MKNLAILIMLPCLASGQFTYDANGLADYIVIESDGDSEQLYTKLKSWVMDTYENPDEVIKADFENDRIRFSGFEKDANCITAAGATVCYNVNYSVEVAVKDGKMKFDPIYYETTTTQGKNRVSLDDGSWMYNKKGKLRPMYSEQPEQIAGLFNGLHSSLVRYLSEEKKDDW